MKCYICKKSIENFPKIETTNPIWREDKEGYAHSTCFKAHSSIVVKPLDVESFIPLPKIENPKIVIDKNVIGEFNG